MRNDTQAVTGHGWLDLTVAAATVRADNVHYVKLNADPLPGLDAD
jgi:hypothetical protein